MDERGTEGAGDTPRPAVHFVNDGSPDGHTNRLLENYPRERARVLTTANQGLAAARNNGIAAAQGPYILPLEAADRILGAGKKSQTPSFLLRKKFQSVRFILSSARSIVL